MASNSYAVDGFSRGSPEKIDHLLSEAKKYKDEGNQQYQNKKFIAAIRCYHKALLYIRSINQGQESVEAMLGMQQKEPLPSDVMLKISKLSLDCHNNLAVCIMQKDKPDYNKVIYYCDLVIAEQPSNYKAHYRKAQALFNLKKYEEALKSFLSAREHMGGTSDAQVRKYIEQCHSAIKEDTQNLSQMYRNMFKQNTAATS